MSDTVAVNQILCCLIYCWKYDNGNIKDCIKLKKETTYKSSESTHRKCALIGQALKILFWKALILPCI